MPNKIRDILCNAVKSRAIVTLRCLGDSEDRYFSPHIVYRATNGNIYVSGIESLDVAKPNEPSKRRYIAVLSIVDVAITVLSFEPDQRINALDPRYGNGCYCAVETAGFPNLR